MLNDKEYPCSYTQCCIECTEVFVLAPTAHFSVSQIMLLDQCSVNASNNNHFRQERPPSPSVNPCIVSLCNSLIRPDQINLLLLRFFDQKIGSSDRKKKKIIIKWEWLKAIIELIHGLVDRQCIFITSDRRAYLALYFLHEEGKKRSWSLLSFPSLFYLDHSLYLQVQY